MEADLKLIEDYIFEKKGVKIKALPPTSMIQVQLFQIALRTALDYFARKQSFGTT